MLRKSKPVYWTWLQKLEYTDFSLLSDYFKANSLWSTDQQIKFYLTNRSSVIFMNF